MRYRLSTILLASLLSSALAACSHNTGQDTAPPVATPTVTFNHDHAPIGSAIAVTYKFVVAPNAPAFDTDYWVFVHVLDPEGEQMWTDDHQPPVPTRQWKPGQTIEYTRTVFIPNYPYVGEANLRIGLYDMTTNKRLPLNAPEVSRREYQVAKLQIQASSENIFITQRDGWHPSESDPKNPQAEWAWTKQTATLSFQNPKKDVTFYLQYDARPDLFPQPQQVTLSVGGQPIGTFAADAKLPTLKTFPITAAQLGDAQTVDMTMQVDKTFKPGGPDPRELGIRVYHTYVAPK